MEKNRKLWALGALLCAMLGLTVFLVIESRYFAVQARELIQLKADYANYVLACKRLIAERAEETSDAQGLKKKKEITDTNSDHATVDDFIVVNRDFNYLRRSALAYARLYKHESAVSQLYQAGRDQVYPMQNSSHRRQRTRRKEQRHVLALRNSSRGDMAESAGLIWPLKRGSYRLSSKFGPRRKPNGSWGFHRGLDMAAPLGVSVQAAQHGVVLEARHARGFGNVVVIAHSNKLKTRYAHLSKIVVQVGDTVEQGQRVGRVGNTGHTTGKNGYHLHFEVIVYGKQTDPLYFLR